MPRRAHRTTVAAIAVVVAIALAAVPAAGVVLSGSPVPHLSPPSSLPSTPQTPSVPQAPSVPQVPSVPSTPAVPHVPSVAPSTSVPAVHVPGGSGSSSGGSSGAGASAGGPAAGAPAAGSAAAAGSGGASSGNGASGAGAHAASARDTASAHAAATRADRRLQTQVRQLAGCLASLPSLERQLLALRAGIAHAPVSLPRAAADLKLPVARARTLERRALVDLHAAGAGGCGTATAPTTIATTVLIGAVPPLQTAVALTTTVSPPLLQPAALERQPGGGVAGAIAASAPVPGAGPYGSAADSPDVALAGLDGPALRVPGLSDATAALWVLLAAAVGALAAMALVRRRRERALQVAAHAPSPWLMPSIAPPAHDELPAPVEQAVTAEPAAPAQPIAPPIAPRLTRARTPAALVASGILSLALRRLVRGRG